MTATSGRKCLGRFGNHARAGSWAKTFAALLVGMPGWSSRRCRPIWRLRGTKYNRLYFLLQASAHHISGNEFGLLPTPVTVYTRKDWTIESLEEKRAEVKKTTNAKPGGPKTGNGFGLNLQHLANNGLLPTPTTQEVIHPDIELTATGRRKAKNGSETHSVGLADLAANGLLPTPQARDWKGPRGAACQAKKGFPMDTLPNMIGATFQLNPRYCLEMMGFPPRWLDIPFQHGTKSSSAGPETP